MKNKLIYLLVIISNCLSVDLCANDTIYYQPNKVFDNDKQADLNDICSHSNGHLYFIYDNKIQKYDGRNLKDIFLLDQNFDSFLRAKEFNGILYVYDYLGQLFFVESDTLKAYSFNNLLTEYNPFKKTLDFYFDERKRLHISNISSSYMIIDSTGSVSFPLINNGFNKSAYYAILKEDGSPFFVGYSNLIIKSPKDTFYLLNKDFGILSKIKINYKSENQAISYAYNNQGDFYFSSGKGDLIHSKDKKLFNQELGLNNINRFYVKDEILWVSTQNDGIFSFDVGLNSLVSKINIEKALIATLDFQGNLWMYQTKGGVYKLDYRKPINYSKTLSYPILGDENLVYTRDGNTYIYSGNEVVHFSLHKYKKTSIQTLGPEVYPTFDNFCIDEKANRWFSRRGIVYCQSENGIARKIEIPDKIFSFHHKFHTYLFSTKNKIWGTHNNYFFELNSAEVGSIYQNENKADIIYLGEYRDSLLIATSNSIHLIAINNISNSKKRVIWEGKDKLINPASFHIRNENINFQFFGSEYRQYSDGKLIDLRILNETKESPFSQFSDKEHWYIIGNNWQIYTHKDASLNQINPIIPQLLRNYFSINNRFFWLEKGQINGIELDSLVKNPKSLKFEKPTLSYDGIEYSEEIHLPNNFNYIKIYFKAISFNSNKVYYRYRLKNNMNWIKTENEEIILSALSPGNYTFNFEVSDDGYNWISGDEIPINIKFPFWKRWWFILSTCLIILLGSITYFKLRLRSIKERNKLELNQLNLEQRILKTQMSPHYLFNVISSLKYLILDGDSIKADQFLSLFSRKLRATLNYSSKKNVTLKEEIDFLKKYIEVETFRNEGELNWKIELEEKVDTELFIPPFLIQPLVENAIKYGVSSLNEDRRIKINFALSNDYLIVSVLDNGEGFVKDFEIDKNSEETSALKILEKRLINHNNSKKNIRITKNKLTNMNIIAIKIRIQK